MIALALGKRRQACAVEVDSIKLNEIGILTGVLSTGSKPNLTVLLIDSVNGADDVLPLCDLVLDPALLGVNQVKMPPAVALRDVNHLVGFFQPVHVFQPQALSMSSPNEGIRLFIDEIADSAGVRIDFNDSVTLMAAIRLDISEMKLVPHPVQAGRFPAVFVSIYFRP